MDTYQKRSLVVSIVVGASIIAQTIFACIVVSYTKRQKTINARQTLLTESALNFNVLIENVRILEKQKDMPSSDEKTALVKKIMDHSDRLNARNTKIIEELNKLRIT
ncbi:hypothetical protein ACFL6S_27245 [Candidatus Poribacteria bacterium]